MVSLKSHAGKRGSVRRNKRTAGKIRKAETLNVNRRVAVLEKGRQRQKKCRILRARREAIARYVGLDAC